MIQALSARHELADKLQPGLSEEDFAIAVRDRSDGNFLYVNYLLQMLEFQPGEVSRKSLQNLPERLSGVYIEFLDRVVDYHRDVWTGQYAPVVGILAVAQEGLLERHLADLVGIRHGHVRWKL